MVEYLPDDVLVGVLYYTGGKKFVYDRERAQRFFCAQKEYFPKLLRDFGFRDRGLFSESEELDQAWANVNHTGLVSSSVTNSFATEECRKMYEKSLKKKFDRKDKMALLLLCDRFKDEFCVRG